MGTQPPSPQRVWTSSPIFGPCLLWPNGWMHQDATWYGGRPQPWGLWVRWGPIPPPKREAEAGGRVPQFSAHGYCGQTAGWIKMARGMAVGVGPVHIVLDGDTAPLPKTGGRAPKFSVHLYCRQTAGCIKMPLGTEVGLRVGLRDIVFDVDPATGRKKGHPPHPIFDPCLLWPNGWMDQDGTWHGGGPWSRPHCARWGPSSPPH